MITGDLDAALAAVISRDGGFGAEPGRGTPQGWVGPGQPLATTSAGTWRPAPPGISSGAGTYATSVAFGLARQWAAEPVATAAALARALGRLDWVGAASVTGHGYLTVTVTPAALTALAARITRAGPGCARSTALVGVTVTAPRRCDLASAPTWNDARRRLIPVITGRLAEAAGATIGFRDDAERIAPANSPAPTGSTPVADAIGFAGADAITYTLARLPHPAPADAGTAAQHHLGNPAYAVRYAHAHAASTLCQAADLGLGLADAAEPRQLAYPAETSLLYELSWLAERVSGAARRAQPDVLTRYLERVAGAYASCQEDCPVLAPGSLPYEGAAGQHPRLWLVAAARTVLRTGLHLLGVGAPARL